MRIGVVGYSAAKFDVDKARVLVTVGLSYFIRYFKDVSESSHEIVSGLTNLGIPALAYEYASMHSIPTVGIACAKARDYECFPVNKELIVGADWGDESEVFLHYCDVLVRVGGGKQSLAEMAAFKKLKPDARVIEFELAEIK